MKNFWLEKRGPKKTKINIWLGASVTGGEEELLETVEVVVPRTEVSCLRWNNGKEKNVYDVQKYNPFSIMCDARDNMLWDLRVGKALCKRNEPLPPNLPNSKIDVLQALPLEIKKAQWTPGEGNKLFRQEVKDQNDMPFYTFHIRNETSSYNATCGYIDKTNWKELTNEIQTSSF